MEEKYENTWLTATSPISQIRLQGLRVLWQLTFALEAFFSQDADEGQELGDLFQVQHSGVVELDDGHGLLVVGTAAAVLPQTGEEQHDKTKCSGGNVKLIAACGLIKHINA